jgi:ribonuclease R
VSHYVRLGSSLDKEALNRGNSVYFPGRVIPMLPEVLSNELCSLKPEVNRLTLVCVMTISQTGKITRFRFAEAVIRSHARLTYNEVYAMVKQQDHALQKKHKDLLPHLEELFSIYKVLHALRQKRGAIDFDLPETKIIFGAGKMSVKAFIVYMKDRQLKNL